MSASRTSAPTRRADDGNRLVLILLIVGTVLALVCAFGPVWFARLGILIAAATAVIVWISMVRTVTRMRQQHTLELTALSLRAAEEMRRERARERATLDAINKRTDELNALIAELRGHLDETVKELDEAYATIVVRDTEIERQRDRALAAEKQHAARQAELAERHHEIVGLRASIERYEAELAELHAQEEAVAADVVGLPRRADRTVVVAEAEARRA